MLKNQTELVKFYQYKSMHILALVIIKQYIMMKYAHLISQFAPLNMCGSGTSFNNTLIRRFKRLICEVGSCQSEGFRDEGV